MAKFKETTVPVERKFVLEMNEHEVMFLKWLVWRALRPPTVEYSTGAGIDACNDLWSLLCLDGDDRIAYDPSKCWKGKK